MANITYFQRYSTLENTVTNNTLQLITRIYAYAPAKASQLLSALVNEEIEIGIEITQQSKGKDSIPDGSIIQRSFKILIESKVGTDPQLGQLMAHAEGFKGEAQQVLLLLTRQRHDALEREVQAGLVEAGKPVVFRNITYEQIYKEVDELFQPYEYEMRELIEDYQAYCREENLVDQSQHILRIVPCGRSFEVNLRHGIYFQPADRGYSDHKYIGIYTNKAVRSVWEVDSVFDVELEGASLVKTLVSGRDTDAYDVKLRQMIRDAKVECGYEVAKGHRFFCGSPIDTYFPKVSSGGIMGPRIYDLREDIGEFENATELAAKLREATWT